MLPQVSLPLAPLHQYCLLPFPRSLIGAVDAACPTAGAAFAFAQFFARARNAFRSGGGLFGILDPAKKFVAGERRQALPESKSLWVSFYRGADIVGCTMDSAVLERVGHGWHP
jgi:hypothetical protein